METDIVVAEKLTKEYNGKTAVRDIDFRVRARECFGFLGPNGAGKTTTMNMIYCFSPVTAGRLNVLGLDVREHPREIKSRLGVVPQENNLDPDLKVLQNLLVYASYFRIPAAVAHDRAMELLEFFDLAGRAQEKEDRLSGGMKRRLTIARALINNPALVILDEPTTGLDPQARHLVWQRLRRLKERGVTLVLTTHYLEEAAQLCDRLVIMDRGEILAEGDPRGLVAKHIGREVVEVGLTGENYSAHHGETPCQDESEVFQRAGRTTAAGNPERTLDQDETELSSLLPSGDCTGNRTGDSHRENRPAALSAPDGSTAKTSGWSEGEPAGICRPSGEREVALLSRVNHLLRGHLTVGDNLFLFPRESGQELLQALQAQPVHFSHLLLRPATLEDVFLKLTGRGLTA